jgi:hypothetical protein
VVSVAGVGSSRAVKGGAAALFAPLFLLAGRASSAPPAGGAENEVIDARIETTNEACVPRAAVENGVRDRSPKVRFSGEATRLARILVSAPSGSAPAGASVRVELELQGENGELARRELVLRSCAEAVNASALIVALWLDPTARIDVPPEEPPPEPPPAPEVEAEAPPPEPPVDANVTVEDGFAWSLGAAAHLALGPAPKPLLGPAMAFSAGASASESGWAPWVRLLGVYDFPLGQVEADGGSARFWLASLGLDACPVALGGATVRVRPCAHAIGGSLRAEGSNTLDARTEARPYWALGASLLGEGELGGGLEVTVSVGVDFPLVRDRFQFEPVVFHEVPAQAGTATLGLAYRAK